MSFHDDLQRGLVTELRVRQWFDRAGIFSLASVGKNPAYDLLLRATLEIKRDDAAARTGNLFLETHSHGVPSGINISQATTYGIVAGGMLYLLGVEYLKAILPQLEKRTVPDGQKIGRILPVCDLRDIPHQRLELGELE